MQPGEFWAMTVQEWFWEYDIRVTNEPEGETFSGPEWDAARAEHRRKLDGNQSSKFSG